LLKNLHRYLLKYLHSYLRKNRHCYLPFTHKMLLNEIFWENGHIFGWYAERIPDEFFSRCPQTTLLDLEYQSGKLRGTAVALASSKRMYYGISHYLELEKK